MHIPDGFVSGPINLAGALVAGSVVSLSAWRVSRSLHQRPSTVPLLATTAAFVFAAQMLNFPIGAGTSGHFLGAAFVAALLGGPAASLVIALVLVIQCFGFQDGGLTALGTNIFNMGLVGGLLPYALMRLLRSILPAGKTWYLATVAFVAWLSVLLASAACALELALSGTFPLVVVFPAMVGIHALIGIGEALITVSILSLVAVSRPDLLPAWSRIDPAPRPSPVRRHVWGLAAVSLVLALALAFFVSPFASSSPDGLEKVADTHGFLSLGNTSVWSHSLMPDYSLPGVTSERLSTGLAGLLGTAAIFLLGFFLIRVLSFRSPD